MNPAELVVIGGGPAGIAAATESASRGVSTVLIDENDHLGGKVLKEPNGVEAKYLERAEKETRDDLFEHFSRVRDRITIHFNSIVWGIFEDKSIAFCSETGDHQGIFSMKAEKLVIPSGAFDRPIPFPGWTLPGIFSTGGLNTFVKHYGVLPGREFLLAGSGPLQLALASTLIKAGAKIAGIVEAASLGDVGTNLVPLLNGGRVLATGMKILWDIKKHRIPILRSHVLSRVHGVEGVEKAVVTRVDREWRPIPGTEKEIKADTIAIGYGLVPSNELARVCGCKCHFDQDLGYWAVEHDQQMETSVPGVFVAGDGVTVKGYLAAIDEGRIAGIAASAHLGHLRRPEADQLIGRIQERLSRLRRYGRALNRMSTPKPGIWDIVSDDTVICRCEDVTMGDLRAAVADGATDVNHIKRKTRVGMGYCQGRFCGQVINELFWMLKGRPGNREQLPARVPVKPIPIKAFLTS